MFPAALQGLSVPLSGTTPEVQEVQEMQEMQPVGLHGRWIIWPLWRKQKKAHNGSCLGLGEIWVFVQLCYHDILFYQTRISTANQIEYMKANPADEADSFLWRKKSHDDCSCTFLGIGSEAGEKKFTRSLHLATEMSEECLHFRSGKVNVVHPYMCQHHEFASLNQKEKNPF